MCGWSPHPKVASRGHIKESQSDSRMSKDLFTLLDNRVKPYFWRGETVYSWLEARAKDWPLNGLALSGIKGPPTMRKCVMHPYV